MQKTFNIKKMTKVVNVFNSIINNNTYVSVSDIAIFLNAFCGTYSITGHKVKEMIEFSDYQETSIDDVDVGTELKYSKVETITTTDGEVKRFIWKARVILDIFRVDFSGNIEDVGSDFYNGIYENALINTDEDWIDDGILEENVVFLIEEMKKAK